MTAAAKRRNRARSKRIERLAPPPVALDLGTEPTRARLRVDPVGEMASIWRRQGRRNAGELEDAAREIRRIYTLLVSGLMCRAGDLTGVRGHSQPFPAWLAQARHDRYAPWATEMKDDLPVIVDWLVEEIPLRQIDRNRKQRNGRAAEVVDQALTRYAEIAGWLGRVIDR